MKDVCIQSRWSNFMFCHNPCTVPAKCDKGNLDHLSNGHFSLELKGRKKPSSLRKMNVMFILRENNFLTSKVVHIQQSNIKLFLLNLSSILTASNFCACKYHEVWPCKCKVLSSTLSCDALYCAAQVGSNFKSVDEVLKRDSSKWKLLSSTFTCRCLLCCA